MKVINGKNMLSTTEVEERKGIKAGTLRSWRHQGIGPKSFRMGKKLVFYLEEDIDEWLKLQYESNAIGGDAA